MIDSPLVHLTLQGDEPFLLYLREMLRSIGYRGKPTFFYVKESGLLDLITQKEEDRDIEERARATIGDTFEGYEFRVVTGPVENFLRDVRSSWLFLRYQRAFFKKSLHERVISLLDGLRLWVYKEGTWSGVKDICVPIDFSERSKSQVEFAIGLARKLGSSIKLLYALSIARMREKMSEREYQHLRELKQEEAKHMYGDLLHSVDAPIELIDGDPKKDLPKAINSQGCQLVVISRRSNQEVRPMGRTSLHIIRSVKCPVVVL